jgi:ligand-binding sensor domain-containing protein/signal transduction histidine kinase
MGKRRRAACWRLRRFLAPSACLFAATLGLAGDDLPPPFERVDHAGQIPHNNVTALAQDAAGFLWIGTPSGLLRYDGYRFRLHARGEPLDGPRGTYVDALLVDRRGRLWIGTAAGVTLHEPASGRFTPAQAIPGAPPSLADGVIHDMVEDAAGRIWFGGEHGLTAWHTQDGASRTFEPGDGQGLDVDLVTALAVDQHGTLFAGSAQGLYRLPQAASRFQRVDGKPSVADLAGGRIHRLLAMPDGSLWGSHEHGGVFRLAAGGALHWPLRQSDGGVGLMPSGLVQAGAEVWVGGLRGLAGFAPDGAQRWLAEEWESEAPWVPRDGRVLLRDRAGHVWSGGFASGLLRFDPRQRALRVLRSGRVLRRASVAALHAGSDGTVWVGYWDGGVDRFDSQWRRLPQPPALASLNDQEARALIEDAAGRLYLGMRAALLRFDPASGRLEPIRWPERGRRPAIRRLAWQGSSLLVGTDAAVYRLRHGEAVLQRLTPAGQQAQTGFINGFAVDPAGVAWIGANRGLFRLSPDGDALQWVATAASSSGPQGGVVGLLCDRRGRLWVDSADNGLYRLLALDADGARFDAIGERLGMGRRPFGANLLEDAQGRLWVPNFVFDPEREVLHALTRADGVDIGTPWFRSHAALPDGRLLFGGSEGLLQVDPARFRPWDDAPPVVASELRIDGVRQPGDRPRAIRLHPGQRGFALEFAALDFSAPQRLRYRYQLEGIDRDWVGSPSGNRVASYGGLPPGHYRLRVQGSNRAGAWSRHELVLPVEVLPALWQTAAFQVALATLLVAIGWFAVRARTTQIRRRAEALEQVVAERGEALLRSQQQLALNEKLVALGTLTAGVAHEINNPSNFADGAVQNLAVELTAMQTFLHGLAGDDAPAEVLAAIDERFRRLDGMVATAREGHQRIRTIVADLRQLTRLDEAPFKAIRLGDAIRSTLNLVRTRFDRVRFELDLADDPELECAPARIGQVLMNLIVNACQAAEASTEAPLVRICSALQGEGLGVGVIDNGPGMRVGR